MPDDPSNAPTETTEPQVLQWRQLFGPNEFNAHVELSLKYPGKERVTAAKSGIGCLRCQAVQVLPPCPNCTSTAFEFGLDTDRVLGLFCSRCRRGFSSVTCKDCGADNPITYETLLGRVVPSKGGCFIATAAMGTARAPEVIALVTFRDRILQRSSVGRRAVKAYYAISPPLAAIIADSPTARAIVRSCLVVPMSKLASLALWARSAGAKSHKIKAG